MGIWKGPALIWGFGVGGNNPFVCVLLDSKSKIRLRLRVGVSSTRTLGSPGSRDVVDEEAPIFLDLSRPISTE